MPFGHRRPGARALLLDRLVRPDQASPGAKAMAAADAADAEATHEETALKTGTADGRGRPLPLRQAYGLNGLRQSVLEQLQWLLNTRVTIKYPTLDARIRDGQRSTIDYGVPDLSSYSVGDTTAMARLSLHLAQTIAWFEPRLSHPKVQIGALDSGNQRLGVHVSGTITAGMSAMPVTFSIEVGATEGPRHAG